MLKLKFILSFFFSRANHNAQWEACVSVPDFDWKQIAEPVMQLYMETTDGSNIEAKESALVWNYEYADRDFGSCQAKELLDHLESVLSNEPVSVKSSSNVVEVKPQVSNQSISLLLIHIGTCRTILIPLPQIFYGLMNTFGQAKCEMSSFLLRSLMT